MVDAELSVSAIIPLFNGGRYIGQALESVFAQDLPPNEVIVVDDGSTDDGPEIVRRYAATNALTLLRKENGGQSSARNFGIRHASGTLIALLDQDDLWYPNHLTELTRPFRATSHGAIGWTYSNLDEIGAEGRLRARSVLSTGTAEHPKRDLMRCLQEDMFILPSCSVILRTAFDAVGGFDERLSGYEDDDLFVRMFVAGYHNIYLEEPLGQWRVYSTSSSFSARMAKSRMIYARKLFESFPDQPVFHRYYGRQLLAPRFLRQVTEAARDALRQGDLATAETALDDIAFLERKIAPEPTPYPLRDELLVTAIIPLHNGAKVIGNALRSILRQTRTVDEIIVVDDGSTDEGPAIVRQFASDPRVRLVEKPCGGMASARNAGVQAAHGDVVGFLDQDDLWYANHIDVLLAPFLKERHRELGWTYADLDEVAADGSMITRNYIDRLPGSHPKRDLLQCLRNDMNVFFSSALVSRKAYLAVGACDERLSAFEDDDLFVRMFVAGYENVYIPDPLCAWCRQRSAIQDGALVTASRDVYVRKLLQRFPDDAETGRFYTTEMIAPRFLRAIMRDLRAAVVTGRPEQQAAAQTSLRLIARNLPNMQRVLMQRLVLPALGSRMMTRLVMRHRRLAYALARRLF
jgi:glycosyltransferase involved in cell wall biosynthesis